MRPTMVFPLTSVCQNESCNFKVPSSLTTAVAIICINIYQTQVQLNVHVF